MKTKILVMSLIVILAFSPLLGSGDADSSQENSVQVHADGFFIYIDTESPAVEFHSVNGSALFSVHYTSIYLYSNDIDNPECVADIRNSSWASISNTFEEDGATKTIVKMSSYVTMKSSTTEIQRWGNIIFTFRITVKGDEAQLGVSLEMKDLKEIDGVSHLAIVQQINSNEKVSNGDYRLYVSGVNYRWDPTAKMVDSGTTAEKKVSSEYSNGTLYLIYPYDKGVRDISHYSGRVNIGSYAVIRDITGDIIGYGAGILLGSILLGIPYATHKKREKSPFDMNSPLYKK
jgi:hypothetical protein